MNLYLKAEEQLQKKYGIQLLDEIVLARQDRAIYYIEYLTDKIQFTKIHGKSPFDLLPNGDCFTFDMVEGMFDMTSKYGEVAGQEFYKTKNLNMIRNLHTEGNITIPLLLNGKRYWIRFHAYSTKSNDDGSTLVASCYITDVTRYLISEEELYEKTHKDELTHLFNRYALYYHFEIWGARTPITAFYFDIDDFKQYNDTYGHEVGDEVLKLFANKLLELTNDKFSAYRIGGDEFYCLLTDTNPSQAKQYIKQLQQMIHDSQVDGVDETLSLSIGVVTSYDVITKKYQPFMKAGDKAMYEAKKSGKNKAIFKHFQVY